MKGCTGGSVWCGARGGAAADSRTTPSTKRSGEPIRHRTFRLGLVELALMVGAVVTTSVRAQSGQEIPAGVGSQGVSRYSLLPDSSDNIGKAIDRTVAHMNFITRPIARSRLNKVNPRPSSLRVAVQADSVSVAFDNGNPVVTPLNGNTIPWANPLTHETDQARGSVVADTIRQTLAAPDGERENALVFSDGGARLRLTVTVRSHRLPRPLVYELVFRRMDEEQAG
jgi:hypothetical protein